MGDDYASIGKSYVQRVCKTLLIYLTRFSMLL